ncbi:MAG: leucyl/phenylalanyl-tRNA--protein transferase [Desulfobacterales bacterium]|nr:leucyl/phenylalanyl-tRNA--protein transferase [Desulfobacterales bacterium]MBU8911145.1 leucyl/phenylalanyl-tRNA--protein transferase [Desulfobacterales bacterium]
MPLFRLSKKLDFPPAWLSRSDGLLCVGGDLSPKRLLIAYANGIFPWFLKDEPILWWSPDPRLVLFPKDINISKSLNKKIRQNLFKVTIDNAFERTIISCAGPRKNGAKGTWLVDEMIDSYIKLHKLGHAHSIETWRDSRLVGGLYGVCLGGSFFGESMFSFENDTSKIALVAIANYLEKYDFDLIDCQVTTNHLLNMGAIEITRNSFLNIINKSVKRKDIKNIWNPDISLKII